MESKSAVKPAPRPAKKPATERSAGIVALVDWERIELDYRAGIKTLRQIADENGISHALIVRRSKRGDWVRDLSAKIHAKAESIVSKAGVTSDGVTSAVTTKSRITEREVVDANATAIADIRLAHRHDIHRARRISNALLGELELQTDPATLDMLRTLGELLRAEDDKGSDKRNDLYRAVLGLSERSKTMKTLSESLRVLVDMERTAFGMEKGEGQTVDALGKVLQTIATGNSSAFVPVQHDPERLAAAPVPSIYDED